MTNVIYLFDLKTYPVEVKEYLKNIDDYEEAVMDRLLKNYKLFCIHITRTYDVDSFRKLGLMRPFVVIDARTDNYYINYKIKEYILKPLKLVLGRKKSCHISKRYDETLIDEYLRGKNKDIEGWYGKFSNVCFTFENYDNTVKNVGNRNFINYAGGELLTHEEQMKIKHLTKPYAIVFNLKFGEFTGEMKKSLYFDMMCLVKNGNFKCYPSGHINRDLKPNEIDIIPIEEENLDE